MRDKNIWVFNAGNAFSGNPKWLFLYVTENHPEICCWWLCYRDDLVDQMRSMGYNACLFKSRQAEDVGSRAGVYVVDQNKETYQPYLRGITVLNTWHGVGCKNIEHAVRGGFMDEGIARKHIRNEAVYRNQLFVVTSPLMERHFVEQCKLEERQLIRSGYPNCIYPGFGLVATFDHDLLASRGLPPETRIAVYAPTFRDFDRTGFLSRAIPDMDALVRVLEETGILMVLKMHPQMEDDFQFRSLKERYADCPHLLFWDNKNDFYEVMDQVDLAVVDYSSIFYDLLAHGVRRFVRYAFDYGDGSELRDFALDYREHTCGVFCDDFGALLEALRAFDETDSGEIDRIKELFWSYAEDVTLEDMVQQALRYEPSELKLPTLYSFDVFDTLLARTTVSPKGVFSYVQDKIRLAGLLCPDYVGRNFVKVRTWAERNCRQRLDKATENKPDAWTEVGLDDIYDRIAELYPMDQTAIEQMKEWEIEGELVTSSPITENISKVRELAAAGETVVLISDMYLPETLVKTLLRKADPLLAELPLFLSSSCGRQKMKGTLFLEVYHSIDYRFGNWVHIGDSKKSDVAIPKTLGIETERYVCETKRDEYDDAIVEFSPTFDFRQVSGLMSAFKRDHDSVEDVFAYCYASLYLVPYVYWAVHHALDQGVTCLYFISRDGHHLKRIADAIIAEEGLSMHARYIYGSRKAWRIPSQVDEIDDDFFSPHGNFTGVTDYNSLLEAAAVDAATFESMFPQLAGLEKQEEFGGDLIERIVETLKGSAQYRSHLLEQAALERKQVCRYLEQEVDFSEKFAFVEFWARGYTQTCLSRLLHEVDPSRKGSIFYYARSIYPTEGCEVRYNFTPNSYSLLFIEALFANLPYRSVQSYREVDGRVVPLVEEADYIEGVFRSVEQWLPEFAHDFCRLELLDAETTCRELFDFGLSYFHRNIADEVFLQCIAPLRYAQSIHGTPVEFAPAWTAADVVAKVRGEQLESRNLKMSMARSKAPYQMAFRGYQVFKKALRRIRGA